VVTTPRVSGDQRRLSDARIGRRRAGRALRRPARAGGNRCRVRVRRRRQTALRQPRVEALTAGRADDASRVDALLAALEAKGFNLDDPATGARVMTEPPKSLRQAVLAAFRDDPELRGLYERAKAELAAERAAQRRPPSAAPKQRCPKSRRRH
jgi:hypothetical protein